jgi:hypothetical protein
MKLKQEQGEGSSKEGTKPLYLWWAYNYESRASITRRRICDNRDRFEHINKMLAIKMKQVHQKKKANLQNINLER